MPNPLESPGFVTAMTANMKCDARKKLFDLPQWIDVPEETLERLAGILAEFEMEAMQNRTSPAEIGLLRDAQIAQVLGYSRFLRWQSYERATAARKYVREMGNNLPFGEHLAWEKVPLLAMAMSQAEEAVRGEATPMADRPIQDPTAEVDLAQRVADAMLASAEAYVSDEQLAMLSEVIQQDVDNLRATYAMQGALR